MRSGLWRGFIVLTLGMVAAASIGAQTLDPKQKPGPKFDPGTLRGGSFRVDDHEIGVSAAQMTRHYRLIEGLNPKSSPKRRLELAWARAIRVEAARALGLGKSAAEFSTWMAETHAAQRDTWAPNGIVDHKLLEAWVKARGFVSLKAYEAYLYEEFLGEQFADREFGSSPLTEEDVRQRFSELTTSYRVSVYAMGPDTHLAKKAHQPDNPEALAAYLKWFTALTPQRQRSFDDLDRPAVACEALYCDFSSFYPASFKTFFEAPRAEPGGSFAKRCASFEPSAVDISKIHGRWDQFRFSHLSRLNADLPAKLDGAESFAILKDHLIREWKMTRYLGAVRSEIDAGPRPIDLEAWAAKTGLSHVRLGLRAIAQHVNHPTFRGTHYYGLRRVKAGELYRGGKHTANPGSLYYVDGIVEQPGYHASIWKLDEFQDMRLRSAEEVRARAWPVFEEELRWFDTQNEYRNWDAKFEAEVKAKIKGAKENGQKIERDEARTMAFAALSEGQMNLKLVAPVFIRPAAGLTPPVNPKSILGQRVQNALNRDGIELYPPQRRLLRPGDVLGPALSPGYRLGFVALIDEVIAPSASRFQIDHQTRRKAKESLRLGRLRQKLARARTASRWGVLKHRYELKSADLSAVMGGK
ncbi:MAG: hypothetical protein V3W41_16895 [Planctomycetota bacterium]